MKAYVAVTDRDWFRFLRERPDLDEWCEWLRRRPLAVAGELGRRPFLLVHAAVHPAWTRDAALAAARRVEAELGADDRELLRRLLVRRSDDLGRLVSCLPHRFREAVRAGYFDEERPSIELVRKIPASVSR